MTRAPSAAGGVTTERFLDELNRVDAPAAIAALLASCGSPTWAVQIERGRPYGSADELLEAANQAFDVLEPADWLTAFAAHARLGDPDAEDPRGSAEQAGAAHAPADLLAALRAGNAAYEARFGHVFLICAAGLDATAMVAALGARLPNSPELELDLAAAEQRKITHLRLLGLLGRSTSPGAAARR